MQKTRVPLLIRELRSCMLHNVAKEINAILKINKAPVFGSVAWLAITFICEWKGLVIRNIRPLVLW